MKLKFVLLSISIIFLTGCGIDKALSPTSIPEPTATASFSGLEDLTSGTPILEIIRQFPLPGQLMPLDGVIEITFNQAMNQKSSTSAWQLQDAAGKNIPGEITWPAGNVLRYKSQIQLTPGSRYTAVLSKKALSMGGENLKEDFHLSFSTVAGFNVSQVFPLNHSKDIENDSAITVVFNQPVVPLTVGDQKLDLPDPLVFSPEISGHGAWVNTSVYVFEPDEPLPGNTQYSAVIGADFESFDGQVLPEPYTWDFTTRAPLVRGYRLLNGQWNPRNGYPDILRDQTFVIDFFQPMNTDSVEAAFSLRIYSEEEKSIPVSFKWDDQKLSLQISPRQKLDYDTKYMFDLDKSALALSGGELENGIHWYFSTIPLPAIERVIPANHSKVRRNNFQILFASPMDFDTLKGKIIFTPQLEETSVSTYYNVWDNSLYIYGLAPSTSYQVQILPGMRDIYGTPIKEEMLVDFQTLPFEPYLYAAGLNTYRPLIFSDKSEQQLFFRYTNIEEIKMELAPIDEISAIKSLSWEHKFNFSQLKFESWLIPVETELNINHLSSAKFHVEETKALEPGFYGMRVSSPQITYGIHGPTKQVGIFVIATHNLTLKVSNYESLAWLTDWDTGLPSQGIEVQFYSYKLKKLGQAVTNKDGIARLADAQVAFAVVNDGQNTAAASLDWDTGVSPYQFNIPSSYRSSPSYTDTYLYTDRPLYRPGQPVNFKGIVRLNRDLDYSLISLEKAHVVIKNYENEKVYSKALALSEFGSFSGEFLLDENAALGLYRIEVYRNASLTNNSMIGQLAFNVGEYRKPEFLVDITTDRKNLVNGDKLNLEVAATYFAGGAVNHGEARIRISHRPFIFSPEGKYANYSFSDFDRYVYGYNNYYSNSWQSFKETGGSLDKEGKFNQEIEFDITEFTQGQQFSIWAEVEDQSGQTSVSSADIVVHESAAYAGIRSQVFLTRIGDEKIIELVALDWDQNPLPGKVVDVEIIKRTWHSIQEKDENGILRWNSSVQETLAKKYYNIVLDDEGHAQISFVPKTGGTYKAVVHVKDPSGNKAQASVYFWVFGEDFIPWRQNNDRSFELVSDKSEYTPGETAEILIASPYAGPAYAWITVERGGIKSSDVIYLDNNNTIYKIPITKDMTPAVYVSAVIIKGKDKDFASYKVSMLELKVDTQLQELLIQLTPDHDQAGPGDEVTYQIK
ncbi:MAG: Ig-like domain-containing protein, partial [Anaerolineae bacterium]|nr:Ig-like domain-containing protein [Anaerolineae bacterium]